MEVIQHDLSLPEDRLLLCPIGDIQYDGGDRCDLRRLQEVLGEALERPGARFVGTGDYVDFLAPSNQRRLVAAALYETAREVIDRAAMALVEELYELALAPTRGKWLGLVTGHHAYVASNGAHSDEYLARLLDAPYLGTSAMVIVRMASAPEPLRLFVHHGWSSARTVAGELPELERTAASMGADFIIVGHAHKLRAVPIARLTTSEGEDGRYHLVARTVWLVQAGSFAKHWAENSRFGGRAQGSYAEARGLRPTVLGAPLLEIRPHWTDDGRFTWRTRAIVEG